MKPLLFTVLSPYTRAQKVAFFLQMLLFFGGATGGIGLWVGKTFVFEPAVEPAIVQSVNVLVPTPWGHRAGIALVEVTLDRLGRCDLLIGNQTYPGGTTVADQFRFVVHAPSFAGWYPLPVSARPEWLQNIEVNTNLLTEPVNQEDQ